MPVVLRAVATAICLVSPPALFAAPGAVVEEGSTNPAVASLRAGDVIVGWSRGEEQGSIASPFDLRWVVLEHLALGEVTLTVVREGTRTTVAIPSSAWPLDIAVRPPLDPTASALYEEGRSLARAKAIDGAVEKWRELLSGDLGDDARCWLMGRVTAARAAAGQRAESEQAHRDGLACASNRRARVRAVLQENLGRHAQQQGWLDLAQEAFDASVKEWTDDGSELAATDAVVSLGWVRYMRGGTDEGIDLCRKALVTLETRRVDGLPLVHALASLGGILAVRGSLDEAERVLARADRIGQALAPEAPVHMRALRFLGGTLHGRGDYVGADHVWRRALELCRDVESAAALSLNLGAIAFERGDSAVGEAWTRRALSLAEEAASPRLRALALSNLGQGRLFHGDRARAQSLIEEALRVLESVPSDHYDQIEPLLALGRLAVARNDAAEARRLFTRAVTLCKEMSGGGIHSLLPLLELADLDRVQGRWAEAEGLYQQAMPIVGNLGPVGPHQARILHGQGALELSRGHAAEATDLFRRAVDALEAQRGRLGSSDTARTFYASRFFGIYHDLVELLVDQGRAAEAYRVHERSRARALLALLAERDVVLEDEIPPEMEKERRRLDAEYQGVHDALLQLDPVRARSRVQERQLRLAALKDGQAALAEKIREISPRLAGLRYPQPMGAREVASTLPNGTLLISYSVGRERTVVFAVGSDGEVEAKVISIGEADLRRTVEAWRGAVERIVPPPSFHAQGRELYGLLVRPLEHRLQGKTRVLVSPDGPLHSLPFAALRVGKRYLGERLTLVMVPSGTVQAEWNRPRPDRWTESNLAVFADPQHPASGLARLPGTRLEARALRGLFPTGHLYLGDEATEAQAKSTGRDSRYLHFASHALIDDGSPLDSGLALHKTESAADDGVLQAWEIYEHVRLDADLVTLSACRTASGAATGEGLLGLTRAFQYAGARTVLASLWGVGDTSSLWFMKRFYAQLARGVPKDEALHRTQQAAIRAGHHPIRWAAYQLYGDWR
jgi:CHAT domain-containing protein/Tfp pilus assembly protein PilF